tara:strand:+ start:88 stop:366 length:279 start_codon:yes stop_codon:yes gene_type:complete
MNILLKHAKKQELHHFDSIKEGKSVVVYVLKAHKNSIGIYDFANSIERENTTNQYAIGIYSRGELKEMTAHSKRHTNLTGEYVTEMETCLAL